MDTNKPFTVSYWGSDPDAGNDDCWTGLDFATEAEARTAYDNWREVDPINIPDTTHVELTKLLDDGTLEILDTKRVAPDRKRVRDDDWRREIAMEAGMLHGVDAYNDEMGWS